MEKGIEDIIYEAALKHAVLNAYKHGGKADLKAVMGKVIAEIPEARKSVRALIPVIEKAVKDADKMSLDEQRRFLEEKYPDLLTERAREETRGLPPLPNAVEGKVVTRFAPNPDFVIHLGNSRVAILSHEYARMYRGKMILRFEDTDPRTKRPMLEAYDLIKEDLAWLGVKWDEEYIQSLRMNIYYSIAKRLIEAGGAYVDTLNVKMGESGGRPGRFVPPPTRDLGPEVNLELFDKMLSGHYDEGEAVVRVKTELDLSDKSLIDWIAFRIIDTEAYPHPITGSKYFVWPTYNFSVAVDDYLMGVTHIIRGKEHLSNTYKQRYIYQHLGWKMPETIHVGRLKLEGFIMSKTAIKKILADKPHYYYGPEDPRFGTIMALRKRGISPEAIRLLMLDVGIKPTDASISYANLAAENRKIIDPISPRLSFVWDPVRLKVSGLSECIDAKLPYHPNNPSMGYRTYRICEGDEVAITREDYTRNLGKLLRLMEAANFHVAEDRLVFHSISLDEAKRQGAPIIHWVISRETPEAHVLKPEGDELITVRGLIESKAEEKLSLGKTYQLLRYGFVRLDSTRPVLTFIYTHD